MAVMAGLHIEDDAEDDFQDTQYRGPSPAYHVLFGKCNYHLDDTRNEHQYGEECCHAYVAFARIGEDENTHHEDGHAEYQHCPPIAC